jgi:hypothetical protein
MIKLRTISRYAVLLAVLAAAAILPASAIASTPPTITGPATSKTYVVPFTISEVVSTFATVEFYCSVDGGLFRQCSNGATPSCQLNAANMRECSVVTTAFALAQGKHTIAAYISICEDPGGCDPGEFEISQSASKSFIVDTIGPLIKFGAAPTIADPVLKKGRTIAFTTSEPATTTCEIDAGDPLPCTSPYALPKLANGRYRLTVNATDAAGNVAHRPHGFKVDIFTPKHCKKSHSSSGKAKLKKCKARNAVLRKSWKKKHHLK